MTRSLSPGDVDAYVDQVLGALRPRLEQHARAAAFGRVAVPAPDDRVDTMLARLDLAFPLPDTAQRAIRAQRAANRQREAAAVIIIDLSADLTEADGSGRLSVPVGARRRLAAGDVVVAGNADLWSWVVIDEIADGVVHFHLVSEREAAEPADLITGKTFPATPGSDEWPTKLIAGSRALVTDTGTTIRSWLIFGTDLNWTPTILALEDRPYASEEGRAAARDAADASCSDLLDRLRALDDDQLQALVQQVGGRAAAALLDRILRYWDRPRLFGVDWLRCGPSRQTTFMSAVGQDQDWDLATGTKVMLAGDGFPDLHGTVLEVKDDGWLVELLWNAPDD